MWHQWMVHWFSFRALSMRGMLHTINPQHKNCRHSRIHFFSHTYSQDKFRGLYPSINNIHYFSLGITKSHCYLPLIRIWYTKCSKINLNNPQPRHTCTQTHQDNTLSYLPSTYIAIGINSTINSCCTLICTISKGGLRNGTSSKGSINITAITSKISTQASMIQTALYQQTIAFPQHPVYSSLAVSHTSNGFDTTSHTLM